jgi:hypothetical protein
MLILSSKTLPFPLLNAYQFFVSALNKKTIYVVDPDYDMAGCRLRWHYLLDSKSLAQKYRFQALSYNNNMLDAFFALKLINKIYLTLDKRLDLTHKIISLSIIVAALRSSLFVFGKPFHSHHMLAMRILHRFGKCIISDFCDFHSSSNIWYLEAAKLSNVIVCPTLLLAERINLETGHSVFIVPDRIDPVLQLASLDRIENIRSVKIPMSILWFGRAYYGIVPTDSFRIFCDIVSTSCQNINSLKLSIKIVCEYPEKAKLELISKLFGQYLDVHVFQWSNQVISEQLAEPGIALIPYPEPVELCEKSANRLELALFAGKKVYSNGIMPDLDHQIAPFVKVFNGSWDQDSPDNKIDLPTTSEVELIRSYLNKKNASIASQWDDIVENCLLSS